MGSFVGLPGEFGLAPKRRFGGAQQPYEGPGSGIAGAAGAAGRWVGRQGVLGAQPDPEFGPGAFPARRPLKRLDIDVIAPDMDQPDSTIQAAMDEQRALADEARQEINAAPRPGPPTHGGPSDTTAASPTGQFFEPGGPPSRRFLPDASQGYMELSGPGTGRAARAADTLTGGRGGGIAAAAEERPSNRFETGIAAASGQQGPWGEQEYVAMGTGGGAWGKSERTLPVSPWQQGESRRAFQESLRQQDIGRDIQDAEDATYLAELKSKQEDPTGIEAELQRVEAEKEAAMGIQQAGMDREFDREDKRDAAMRGRLGAMDAEYQDRMRALQEDPDFQSASEEDQREAMIRLQDEFDRRVKGFLAPGGRVSSDSWFGGGI